MKSKKTKKPRKTLKPRSKPKPKKTKKVKGKRKQPKAKAVRGTASAIRIVVKKRKRPVLKKVKKLKVPKDLRFLRMRRHMGMGRSDGFLPALKKHYEEAKDTLERHYNTAKRKLGEFYDENEDVIDTAAKVALGAVGAGALGVGAYSALKNPEVLKQLVKLKDIASDVASPAVKALQRLVRNEEVDSRAPGARTAGPAVSQRQLAPNAKRNGPAAEVIHDVQRIVGDIKIGLMDPYTTSTQRLTMLSILDTQLERLGLLSNLPPQLQPLRYELVGLINDIREQIAPVAPKPMMQQGTQKASAFRYFADDDDDD